VAPQASRPPPLTRRRDLPRNREHNRRLHILRPEIVAEKPHAVLREPAVRAAPRNSCVSGEPEMTVADDQRQEPGAEHTPKRKYPNTVPRPEDELPKLREPWVPPRGWRIFSAVNNTYVGLTYIAVGLIIFVLAGVLAVLMRTQLAVPENTLIGHTLYNQLFTMHGTMMMFLFAVPIVEAFGILLMPN